MAQAVENLACKPEALSSNPSNGGDIVHIMSGITEFLCFRKT
jgi:hypothetical protein